MQSKRVAEGLFTHDYSLGARAHWLADNAFDGHLVPAKIIDHHTHVPLFANMMTLPGEFAWREELLRPKGEKGGIAQRFGRLTCVESESLRRCPTCVAEDRKLYGCAHWRLFHQWPVARHCVVHGDLLETCCAACRTPFLKGKDAFLADDACRRCGGRDGAPPCARDAVPPEGYWPLLEEMYRLLRQSPYSVGSRRYELPRSFSEPKGATERLEQSGMPIWVSEALRSWQVESLAQLADALGEDWVWFNRVDKAAQFREWPPLVKLVLGMSFRRFASNAISPLEQARAGGRAHLNLLPGLESGRMRIQAWI